MEKKLPKKKLPKKKLPKKNPLNILQKPPKKPPQLYEKRSKTPPKILQKSPKKNPPEIYLKKIRIPKIWSKIRIVFSIRYCMLWRYPLEYARLGDCSMLCRSDRPTLDLSKWADHSLWCLFGNCFLTITTAVLDGLRASGGQILGKFWPPISLKRANPAVVMVRNWLPTFILRIPLRYL